jgi:hypothetical protein
MQSPTGQVAMSPAEERLIVLGDKVARLPERLLLAHAKGRVLFITGAGTSRPSGLPDFRKLVVDVYKNVDRAVHEVLEQVPVGACNRWPSRLSSLDSKQQAEVRRFISGEYDVVLGMLERRIDGTSSDLLTVRSNVCDALKKVIDASGNLLDPKPSAIHKSLARLGNRGAATTLVTTNFDLLLEQALRSKGTTRSSALGAVPRPGMKDAFAGVLHIHGALSANDEQSEVVLTDRDFGEYYLRRRVVPDFIYDAARLFHLVLVGYSASDAPMRYLLNAVAADGSRFSDLKERFAFVGMSEPFDQTEIEDWRGRGITPIPYDCKDGHAELAGTLDKWAALSAINGAPKQVDRLIRRIVKIPRKLVDDASRDLVDHFIRRSAMNERLRLTSVAKKARADGDWLNAFIAVGREADLEYT